MDKRGGLKSVTGGGVRHLLGGQPAQFLIDQRQQFLRSFGVALLNPVEDAGQVVHAGQHGRKWRPKRAPDSTLDRTIPYARNVGKGPGASGGVQGLSTKPAFRSLERNPYSLSPTWA